MATYVQGGGAAIWDNVNLTGVSEGSALFFVGVGQDGGTASVDSFTAGGVAPDGSALVQDINGSLCFFAWWNSVSAGDYQVVTSTTSITQNDGILYEYSGWAGTGTSHDGTNSGFTSTAGTSHDAGSVTLSGAGMVLTGARHDPGTLDSWTDTGLTRFDWGSREATAHGYFASGQSVSGAWTSNTSVTSETAIIAIPEGGGGGATFEPAWAINSTVTIQ